MTLEQITCFYGVPRELSKEELASDATSFGFTVALNEERGNVPFTRAYLLSKLSYWKPSDELLARLKDCEIYKLCGPNSNLAPLRETLNKKGYIQIRNGD